MTNMTELTYTPEFFTALEKMVDKRPHKCQGCWISDGVRRINKDGSKQHFPSIVRLCLIDPTRPANDVNNIGMYCTRCRKPDQVWKTPRRMKPSSLPQLFKSDEKSLIERIQSEARNKIPPKPPQLDDDGDPLPF